MVILMKILRDDKKETKSEAVKTGEADAEPKC